MAEIKFEVPEFREHVIYARVSKSLYGRVYHASQETGASMSVIASMCIEKVLDMVVSEIKRKGIKR
jgi:hypothetical protein